MAHFNHDRHEIPSTKSMICVGLLCRQEALGITETRGGGLGTVLASLSSWLASPLN